MHKGFSNILTTIGRILIRLSSSFWFLGPILKTDFVLKDADNFEEKNHILNSEQVFSAKKISLSVFLLECQYLELACLFPSF